MEERYIAHINEYTGQCQSVYDHSVNTAEICKNFVISDLKETAFFMGMLHDCGKYSKAFQHRIQDGANIRVEHSICGAHVAREIYRSSVLGMLLQYCIAGHHSGIPDGGLPNDTPNDLSTGSTLSARLKREFEDFCVYKKELELPQINLQKFNEFFIRDCNSDMAKAIDKFAFLTRYCFSCLVDADSIDTAQFCGTYHERKLKADFVTCLDKINHRLASFVCKSELQKTRALLQRQVFEKVNQDAEIYLMHMPTGSGKTLCSMKFALERAIKKEKKRIIYIIPYNSIINQTSEEFANLFQECAEILRHQSTFVYEDQERYDEDYRNAAKLAAENWDAPFIITTVVQFFESIYSNKRSKLRKLHNMADSILVFDEAHLMPLEYLQPCLQAVSYITHYLNSEAVFLTATMPDFRKLINKYALPESMIFDLVDDRTKFSAFRKCDFVYMEKVKPEELLKRTREYPASLIVVNRRKDARNLYERCSGKKYHLSTYMTSKDRDRVLTEIRNEMRNLDHDFGALNEIPEEQKITIISTSLIEAGVDLDLFAVFRELTGLDSILQAGGRCNREGKRKDAKTFIFEFDEARSSRTDERSNMTRGLLAKYKDISSAECIEEYYERYYDLKQEEIQSHTLSMKCKSIGSIPFRSYAEQFELIGDRTVSVIVPQDEESRKLLENVEYTGIGTMRKLQKYACSLKLWELNDLLKQHAVVETANGIRYLSNLDYYSRDVGILFEAKDYFL